MKKVAYIAGGILIGFVLSTSAGAFADSVKSLVGKKVSGEYTVIVDGKTLSDKGAVIDGKANVPVRGISEALGADIKVSGKTITITSPDEPTASEAEDNKYTNMSKQSIEESVRTLKQNLIPFNERVRADLVKAIEQAEEAGLAELANGKRAELAETDARIAQANADIAQAEAALAALK